MGLLMVTGTLSLDQFWPSGESDADTAKVIVTGTSNAFHFQKDPSRPAKVTHVFDQAKVRGKSGTKPAIDANGRLTIRFQGIDATELHYRPSPLQAKPKTGPDPLAAFRAAFKSLNKQYRQLFGETATVQLHELLARTGQAELPCRVTTEVDSPNDVFDVFGRFIGDIHVTLNKRSVNLNHWLVEEGWAFPTFYASMSSTEINAFLAAAKKGKQKRQRLWQHLRKVVGQFDTALIFRGKGAALNPAADVGSVLMPKLFRRLCTYSVYKRVGIVSGNFHDYLKTTETTICYLTSDFLAQGAAASPHHFLHEFVAADGKISKHPDELVFAEGSSTLIGPDGKKITDWQ